jgi:cytochrome c-type biogenesis protein CcsB
MPSQALFSLTVLMYAVSALAHVAAWLGGHRRGERAAQLSLMIAVLLHGVGIGLRWVEAGYVPVSNGFESFSFYAWGLAVLYLSVGSLRRYSVLGLFVTPLALTSILVASVLPRRVEPLVPVLRSNWLPIHVGISFLAYALFTLAFVVAAAYLIQTRALRNPARRLWARRLPPLETLEELQRRLATVGLWLMTGSLLSGSLWAETAWGEVWPWEPQQIAALVTWLIYAVYFYVRHGAHWRDDRCAWLLVGGFASVIITFVGADLLLPGGRHSFLFGM